MAIEARDAYVDTLRSRLFYDGVNYADALKYDLTVNFLPGGDPANTGDTQG